MAQDIHPAATIWRRKRVLAERGLSRSTHYHQIAEGLFTKPVRIAQRAVGWPAREVAALNAARIAGKSDDEIRDLVTKLHAERGARAVEDRPMPSHSGRASKCSEGGSA